MTPFLVLALSAAAGQAQNLPAGFTDSTLATGMDHATAMAIAPDGRVFICEQPGGIRVVKNGALLPARFATVAANYSNDLGLMGIAVDPNFAANGYVYVHYSHTQPANHNRVTRLTASGDVAAAGSEVVIMALDNTGGSVSHMGGAIHFGPDGKLYIATGDNGNSANAQSLSNRFAKMLRINADGTIPSDNPFYATATGNNRAIWAYGFRNPFTFGFQPGTGRMLVSDVGQSGWEEINEGMAGANYGWPATEGPTTNPSYKTPLYAYPHSGATPSGLCVVGAAFYNPAAATFPAAYAGKFFFADHASQWIYSLDPANPGTPTRFATNISYPVDLRVGPDGALYYLARGGYETGGGANVGSLGRIQYSSNVPPSITLQPANRTVPVGQTAIFTVSAAGSPPLSYQWQRNGTDIAGATSSSHTTPPAAPADSGAQFRCVVTNGFGTATSSAATLTVTSNTAPTAAIAAPPAGAQYNAGDTIAYSGTGTDAEDGTLPASAFTWWIDFHHNTHTHPALPAASGATGGSYTIPATGETSDGVWYRIHLRVTDSGGLTHETTRDVTPRKSTLSLRTSPPGLQVTLDGQTVTTPVDVPGVVGMQRTLGVVTPQVSGSTTWQFASWSDGGAQTHAISTPAASTTYTATFQAAPPGGTAGLTGQYYDTIDFSGPSVTRVDGPVDFAWGTGAPIAGVGADTFSVRWTGRVTPLLTEAFTFYTQTDDGARLWVNGELLVDQWVNQSQTEWSGTVALAAGVPATIQFDYYDGTGSASARLLWSSASLPKEVIPSARLTTTTGPPDSRDNDGDGVPNDLDPDDDDDGIPDLQDPDRDGDGVANGVEASAGTDPDDRNSFPAGGGGGSGGCGALGLEALVLASLIRRRAA